MKLTELRNTSKILFARIFNRAKSLFEIVNVSSISSQNTNTTIRNVNAMTSI